MSANWTSRARAICEVHSHDDFISRWGVEELVGENAAYVFNNAPHRGKLTARDAQRDHIRELLGRAGFEELAYGEFPDRGVDEGYSWVLIFKTIDQVDIDRIHDLCQEVFGSEIGWDDSQDGIDVGE